jgi:hypothetical protein
VLDPDHPQAPARTGRSLPMSMSEDILKKRIQTLTKSFVFTLQNVSIRNKDTSPDDRCMICKTNKHVQVFTVKDNHNREYRTCISCSAAVTGHKAKETARDLGSEDLLSSLENEEIEAFDPLPTPKIKEQRGPSKRDIHMDRFKSKKPYGFTNLRVLYENTVQICDFCLKTKTEFQVIESLHGENGHMPYCVCKSCFKKLIPHKDGEPKETYYKYDHPDGPTVIYSTPEHCDKPSNHSIDDIHLDIFMKNEFYSDFRERLQSLRLQSQRLQNQRLSQHQISLHA